MKEVARLLNELREKRLILEYALFGAVAQMRYTEATATLDVDVLVDLPPSERLDVLAPIYAHCSARGYEAEGEAVRVGAWPVQFIPVFSALTREALEQAETADFDGVPLRVLRADHLAVVALSVGRAKDFARIISLFECRAIQREDVARLAEKHGLAVAWKKFEGRFLDD